MLGCKNTPYLDFNYWTTHELKVSWSDSSCELSHKKCYQKRYHGDIKYHMTLNTMSRVV